MNKIKSIFMLKGINQRVVSALVMLAIFIAIILIGSQAMQISFMILVVLMLWEMNKMFKPLRAKRKTMKVEQKKQMASLNLGMMFLIIYAPLRLFGLFTSNYSLAMFILLWTLSFTIFADTGAFFVGSNVKSRKLAPSISPNKTVGGAIGGWIFGSIAGALCAWLFSGNNLEGVSFGAILFIVVAGPIAAILGDLYESKVKRFCGVKDASNIIPGHGGVLDRFDSLLAVLLLIELVII